MSETINVIKLNGVKVVQNENGNFLKKSDIKKLFGFYFNDRDQKNVLNKNPNLIIKCEDKEIVPGGGIPYAFMVEEEGIITAINQRKRGFPKLKKEELILKVKEFFFGLKTDQYPLSDKRFLIKMICYLDELKEYKIYFNEVFSKFPSVQAEEVKNDIKELDQSILKLNEFIKEKT